MSEQDSDVVPQSELERRRRVLACTEDLSDQVKTAVERIRELRDLGVPAEDWLSILGRSSPPIVQGLLARYGDIVGPLIDGFSVPRGNGTTASAITEYLTRPSQADDVEAASPSGRRMQNLIMRLFDEAPKLTEDNGQPRAGQAPALECHVVLKAGVQLAGALSTTSEGLLRMLSPLKDDRGPVMMVEHFFDVEDVADIALMRKVTVTPREEPVIITP